MKKNLILSFFSLLLLISTSSLAESVFKFVPDKSCAGASAIAQKGYHFEKIDDKTVNIVEDTGPDGIHRPATALICEPQGCNAGCLVISVGNNSSCNCKGDGQCSWRVLAR